MGYDGDDTFDDKVNMAWNMAVHQGWMGEMACEDDRPLGSCGYRLIAALMASPKRFLYNIDLYEKHRFENWKSLDEMKPEWLAATGKDPEDLRDCPRPDFYKPVKSAPAVWKVGPAGDNGIYRGYYSMIKQKWCYVKQAVMDCKLCSDEMKRREWGDGDWSGSGVDFSGTNGYSGSGSGTGSGSFSGSGSGSFSGSGSGSFSGSG